MKQCEFMLGCKYQGRGCLRQSYIENCKHRKTKKSGIKKFVKVFNNLHKEGK